MSDFRQPPLIASRLVARAGRILMCRRGDLDPADQRVGPYANRAPEHRGIWAFPWPYFDDFYAHHKLDEVMPKQLTYAVLKPLAKELGWGDPRVEELYAAREAWIREHGDAVRPIRKFWWEGDVYARYDRRGEHPLINDQGLSWHLLDAERYLAATRKVEPRHGNWWGRDHLEVFLAASKGRVVGRVE